MAGYINKSRTNQWGTPPELIKKYCNGPVWDPCKRYPDGEVPVDNLKTEWPDKLIFVNPPYSNLKQWTAKIAEEAKKGRRIVLLMPTRCSTLYARTNIFPYCSYITFPKRVKFISYDFPCTKHCPFDLMIVYYNLNPTWLTETKFSCK